DQCRGRWCHRPSAAGSARRRTVWAWRAGGFRERARGCRAVNRLGRPCAIVAGARWRRDRRGPVRPGIEGSYSRGAPGSKENRTVEPSRGEMDRGPWMEIAPRTLPASALSVLVRRVFLNTPDDPASTPACLRVYAALRAECVEGAHHGADGVLDGLAFGGRQRPVRLRPDGGKRPGVG